MFVVHVPKGNKYVTPRTKEDTPIPEGADLATTWKAFLPRISAQSVEGLKKGMAKASPAMANLAESVIRLSIASELPHDVEPRALAAAFRVGNYCTDVLTAIAKERSVVTAMEAWLHTFEIGFRYDDGTILEEVTTGRAIEWASELGALLLHANADVQKRCKALATEAFNLTRLELASRLARAFFHEVEWGNDVARAWLESTQQYLPYRLLFMTTHDPTLAAQIVDRRRYAMSLEDLVVTLGEDVMPILRKVLAAPKSKQDASSVAYAMNLIESEEVCDLFAQNLSKADFRKLASGYFARYPAMALVSLKKAAEAKGRGQKFAATLLQGLEREQTADVDDAASDDELPEVLRDPPWENRVRHKRPTSTLTIEPLPHEEAVTIEEAQRIEIIERISRFLPTKEATPEALTAWQALAAAGHRIDPFRCPDGSRVPPDLLFRTFEAGASAGGAGWAEMWLLAQFGKKAIPFFVRWVEKHFHLRLPVKLVLQVESPRVAAGLCRVRLHRDVALSYARRYPRASIIGLIPLAFGKDAARRSSAAALLAQMAREGAVETIREVAKEYGANAVRAVEILLAWDEKWECPEKVPVLPEDWASRQYRRPRLVNGKVLPIQAIDRIGVMLAFSDMDNPYVGLLDVRDACESRSIAEFAWDVAKGWEVRGSRKKSKWMLEALVYFADEEVTRRTTPAIRSPYIVEVLQRIGSDAAVMELATIAYRGKSSYLPNGEQAEQHLEEIAAARGVSKGDLEDTIVPTADVDDACMMMLDYGSRKLRVGFDETLDPFILGKDNERLRALPPKKKTDDPDAIAKAKQIWSDLKEDVSAIAVRRISSLERAMIFGRTWDAEAWKKAFLELPLMRHIAQRIVWVSGSSFRVTEDRSLADVADNPLELEDTVRVAHPVRDSLAEWQRVFDDYKLVQPFQQIVRPYPPIPEGTAIELPQPMRANDLADHFRGRGWISTGDMRGWRSPLGDHVRVTFGWGSVKSLTVAYFKDDREARADTLDPVALGEALRDLSF